MDVLLLDIVDDKSIGSEDGKSRPCEDGKSLFEDGESSSVDGDSKKREAYFGSTTFLKWSMYWSTHGRYVVGPSGPAGYSARA